MVLIFKKTLRPHLYLCNSVLKTCESDRDSEAIILKRQKKHFKHEWRTNQEISLVSSYYTKQSEILVLMGETNKTEDRV